MSVNHAVSCHHGSSLVGRWNASCSEGGIALNVTEPPSGSTGHERSIAGMPEDLEERHVELVCTGLRPLVADVGA